jgi:transposase-like protein
MASGSSSFARCVMAFEPVHCPPCHDMTVVKYGKTSDGKPRVRSKSCVSVCDVYTELYLSGDHTELKRTIVDMSLNGSGIRDIARVLHVSPSTVIHELKEPDCNM